MMTPSSQRRPTLWPWPIAAALAVALATLGSGWSQETPPTKPAAKKPTDLEILVRGNNQFAFDLYSKLATKEGNITFSPYSISNALAMTYAGARGKTATEIENVLRFSLGQNRMHPVFSKLVTDLQQNEQTHQSQVYIANAIWSQKGCRFLQKFREIGTTNYRAELEELDFQTRPDIARSKINRWVEQQTNNKIRNLIGQDDLGPSVRLVLTNAVYFKGAWAIPFPEAETREAPFELNSKEKFSVSMMHSQEATFKYFSDRKFKCLELPYTGGRFSMVLILPESGQLADLEQTDFSSVIERAISSLEFRCGKVDLPKFEFCDSVRLKNQLSDMGMATAFSPNANFSGIVEGKDLNIDNVIHQAFVKVNEIGTEATAATAVVMATDDFPPFSFTANRPFVYLIRDNQTKSILFLGRVVRPSRFG